MDNSSSSPINIVMSCLQDNNLYKQNIQQLLNDLVQEGQINQKLIQKIVKSCTQLLSQNRFPPQSTILSMRLIKDILFLHNDKLENIVTDELFPLIKNLVVQFRQQQQGVGYWGDKQQNLLELSETFKQLVYESVYVWSHDSEIKRSEYKQLYLSQKREGLQFNKTLSFFKDTKIKWETPRDKNQVEINQQKIISQNLVNNNKDKLIEEFQVTPQKENQVQDDQDTLLKEIKQFFIKVEELVLNSGDQYNNLSEFGNNVGKLIQKCNQLIDNCLGQDDDFQLQQIDKLLEIQIKLSNTQTLAHKNQPYQQYVNSLKKIFPEQLGQKEFILVKEFSIESQENGNQNEKFLIEQENLQKQIIFKQQQEGNKAKVQQQLERKESDNYQIEKEEEQDFKVIESDKKQKNLNYFEEDKNYQVMENFNRNQQNSIINQSINRAGNNNYFQDNQAQDSSNQIEIKTSEPQAKKNQYFNQEEEFYDPVRAAQQQKDQQEKLNNNQNQPKTEMQSPSLMSQFKQNKNQQVDQLSQKQETIIVLDDSDQEQDYQIKENKNSVKKIQVQQKANQQNFNQNSRLNEIKNPALKNILGDQQFKVNQKGQNNNQSQSQKNSSLNNNSSFQSGRFSVVQNKSYQVQQEEKIIEMKNQIQQLQENLVSTRNEIKREFEIKEKNLVLDCEFYQNQWEEMSEKNLNLEKQLKEKNQNIAVLQEKFQMLETMFEEERQKLKTEKEGLSSQLRELDLNFESVQQVFQQETKDQEILIKKLQEEMFQFKEQEKLVLKEKDQIIFRLKEQISQIQNQELNSNFQNKNNQSPDNLKQQIIEMVNFENYQIIFNLKQSLEEQSIDLKELKKQLEEKEKNQEKYQNEKKNLEQKVSDLNQQIKLLEMNQNEQKVNLNQPFEKNTNNTLEFEKIEGQNALQQNQQFQTVQAVRVSVFDRGNHQKSNSFSSQQYPFQQQDSCENEGSMILQQKNVQKRMSFDSRNNKSYSKHKIFDEIKIPLNSQINQIPQQSPKIPFNSSKYKYNIFEKGKIQQMYQQNQQTNNTISQIQSPHLNQNNLTNQYQTPPLENYSSKAAFSLNSTNQNSSQSKQNNNNNPQATSPQQEQLQINNTHNVAYSYQNQQAQQNSNQKQFNQKHLEIPKASDLEFFASNNTSLSLNVIAGYNFDNISKQIKKLARFKQSCLRSKYPIYEDNKLQIGIISSTNHNNILKLTLFYTNRTEDYINNIHISFIDNFPEISIIASQTIVGNLGPMAQKQQDIQLKNSSKVAKPLSLAVLYQAAPPIVIGLPNTINKFFNFKNVDLENFMLMYHRSKNIISVMVENPHPKICSNEKEINKNLPYLFSLPSQTELGITQYSQFNSQSLKWGTFFECTLNKNHYCLIISKTNSSLLITVSNNKDSEIDQDYVQEQIINTYQFLLQSDEI